VTKPRQVLGVDACKAGWVGIALTDGAVRALVHADISGLVDLAAAFGPIAAIAIDIPIGLADDKPRQADLLARAAAGARWASVFATPVRSALATDDYHRALAISRELTGGGISRQAFNLREKILQVDRWYPLRPCPVVEAHPELSFRAMAGTPLSDSKSSWAGAVTRWRILAGTGIDVRGDLGLSGQRVGVDDVLDAAAVAWTAARVARGAAWCVPDPPERFSDGIDCAIWT
jgi:predicted RNase H-like nuclease